MKVQLGLPPPEPGPFTEADRALLEQFSLLLGPTSIAVRRLLAAYAKLVGETK